MFRSYPNNFGYRYKNWSSKFKQASHRFKTRIQSFYPYPSATSNCITPKKSRATHQTTFQPQGPQGHKNLALCLLTAQENHTQNKSFLKNVTSFHLLCVCTCTHLCMNSARVEGKGQLPGASVV